MIAILIGCGVVIALVYHAAQGVLQHQDDEVLAEAFAKHGGHSYRYQEPDRAVINGRGDAAWQRAEQAERRLRGQG